MTPIVIPLHSGGGKEKTDLELRYALRSIARYVGDPVEVIVIGQRLPDWVREVRWIKQEAGALKTALKMAAEAYPAGFFWWYDDCVLLRAQTVEELRVMVAHEKIQKPHTSWSKKLEKIRVRLEEEGYPSKDYSCPHCPYWFDRGMIDESFADWPGMAGKFPFETWILNKRRWPSRSGVSMQCYGRWKNEPGEDKVFLNWCDAGFSDELKGYLAKKFPDAGKYEREEGGHRVEVHTIRVGQEWWVEHCGATVDRWCAKHGHTLRVWGEKDISPEYPALKFCAVDMLREFLAGDATHLLYVDGDVFVSAEAPRGPDLSVRGLQIARDYPCKNTRRWAGWCARHFGSRNAERVCPGWSYRNAGVWLCDREAACGMLEVIAPPYIEAMQEQNQWNYWLALAAERGMRVPELPVEWNSFASRMQPAAFHHLAGKNKGRKLEALRAAGIVPRDEPLSAGNLNAVFEGRFQAWYLSPDHYEARRARLMGNLEAYGGRLNGWLKRWRARSVSECFAPVSPWFRAVRKAPHYWAATQDHLAILEAALAAGVEALLVIEDDMRVIEDWEPLLEKALAALPQNWRALQLNWNAQNGAGEEPELDVQPAAQSGSGQGAVLWSRAGAIRFYDHALANRHKIIDGCFDELRQMEPALFFRTGRELFQQDPLCMGGDRGK